MMAAAAIIIGALTACSADRLVGGAPLPTNLNDPGATKTLAGAISAYHGTLGVWRDAVGGTKSTLPLTYIYTTGELSDELQSGNIGYVLATIAGEDPRILPEYTASESEPTSGYVYTFSGLNEVRAGVSQTIGLLRDYAPTASPALRGHLYAVEGYAEVMLAELYCSGIPLSTVDYNGDYTLHAGSTTTQVLQHASAQFDTALALSGDSARILNLARVGKARALLDLGDFADAAAAATMVPDGFSYQLSYTAGSADNAATNAPNFAYINPGQGFTFTVSDREGVNGLPYRSSGDPRTAATNVGTNAYGTPIFYPNKYVTDGSSSIVMADWVEARLIQAEAALHSGNPSWLTILNTLRETAITPALPDTTDPGTPESQLNLVFSERAAWLFLTGHREGDLRRLATQYGRNAEQVYPVGPYPGAGSYGNDVNAPIPSAEIANNPLFKGCISRGP
jgi:hypothetical protein